MTRNFGSKLLSRASIEQDYRKIDNKHPSEMGNQHQSSHLSFNKIFHGLGPILTTRLKYWLCVKFLQIFLLANCPMKITVKQSVQQICAPLIWKWLSDLQKYSWLQKLCKFWNKHKIFIYPYTLKRNVFFFVFLIKERLLSSKNIY